MKFQKARFVVSVLLILVFVLSACAAPTPEPTLTPAPTNTPQPTPTNTSTPTVTPKPTKTPNLAATQHIEEFQAEAQSYFDQGFLTTTKGTFKDVKDFRNEWAQLGWYQWELLSSEASDFYMSGHFNWESAYKNADVSGCGFVFSVQENDDHYAVFLDRSEVLFLVTDSTLGYSKKVGPTRGTGRVKFDMPAQAEFTLIVKGAYAYVLVNNEVVGEYTLSQSRSLTGRLGLTVLSGTNKDYGTRCLMTDLHLWTPD
jgi:hypothetical protein